MITALLCWAMGPTKPRPSPDPSSAHTQGGAQHPGMGLPSVAPSCPAPGRGSGMGPACWALPWQALGHPHHCSILAGKCGIIYWRCWICTRSVRVLTAFLDQIYQVCNFLPLMLKHCHVLVILKSLHCTQKVRWSPEFIFMSAISRLDCLFENGSALCLLS